MAVTVHTPSPALNLDDMNPSTNFRTFVKLSGASNGQIRVTIRARSSGTLGIIGASIGKWDGAGISSTGGDMTTVPVRVTFGGSNTVNISGGTTATSDWITHSGSFSLATNDWLIVAFTNNANGNQRYSTGHTDATTMFKVSGTDYSQEQFLVFSSPWSIVGTAQPGDAGGYNFDIELVETNDPAGGAISGTSSLTFAVGGAALTGKGALAGTSSLTFATPVATLRGTGAMSATSSITFNVPNSSLAGFSSISGTSSLTFAVGSGILLGKGAMAGTSSLTFATPVAALRGFGAMTGASSLTFSPTAGGTAYAFASGTSSLTFGPTGTLRGSAPLSGTSSLSFATANATLLGSTALSGTSSLSFTTAAALTGSAPGAMSGTSSLTFSTSTAALLGSGSMSGTSSLTFTVMNGGSDGYPYGNMIAGAMMSLTYDLTLGKEYW